MNRYLEKVASLTGVLETLSGKALKNAKATQEVRRSALNLSKQEAKQAVHNFVNYKVRSGNIVDSAAKLARKNLSETYRGKFTAEASAFRKSSNRVNSIRNKTILSRVGLLGGTTGAVALVNKSE